jgi:hypothetical protein
MRCSYYPQSLVQIRGAIREIGSWIWGSWPAVAVHPELPSLTGLIGVCVTVGVVHPELPRLDRSDRCV